MSQNNDLESLLQNEQEEGPAKAPSKSSFTLLVIIILLALLLAGGVWAALQFMEKGEVEIPLPQDIAQTVTETLRLGDEGRLGPVKIVGTEKQPAKTQQESSGSITGQYQTENENPQAVSGLIAPPELSAESIVLAQIDDEKDGTEKRTKIMTGSDAVVTMGFVNDFAMYLAEHYWPQGTHMAARNAPVSTASIGALNQRYGVDLTGFAATRTRDGKRDFYRDRQLVLNYVLRPSMVSALTKLYADRFAEQLAFLGKQQQRTRNGKHAGMSDKEVADMLRYYADYASSTGVALMTYAENNSAPGLLRKLDASQQAVYAANSNMHETRYAFEIAEEDGKSAETIRKAKADMEKSEKEYRLAMLELEKARQDTVTLMSQGKAAALDPDSLIYIAAWSARRGPGSGASLVSAAKAADYTAYVLEEKAEEISPLSAGQTVLRPIPQLDGLTPVAGGRSSSGLPPDL